MVPVADDRRRDPDGWTGSRPTVSGAPVVIGAAIVGLIVIAILATVTRQPGLVARLSQEYTRVAAGSLAPVLTPDKGPLDRQLRAAGLPFDVRIASLAPEFELLGAAASEVDGRQVAAWMYRTRGSEWVLVEAFPARLDALGPADDTRTDAEPPLRLYRKTTQTIVAWQDGPLVYVLISTLPQEQVVRLARRVAPPPPHAAS